MDNKWIKNGPKTTKKDKQFTKKMVQKLTKNGQKLPQKWTEKD